MFSSYGYQKTMNLKKKNANITSNTGPFLECFCSVGDCLRTMQLQNMKKLKT